MRCIFLCLIIIGLLLVPYAAFAQNVEYVGSYDTPAIGVFVLGNYAYVADGYSGLQVINVSNPADPVFAGSYDTPGYAMGVFILDNYAYVADQGSLQIINVANPANPVFAGSYGTLGSASGVFVSDNYAHVADGYSGLQVINIADPANPIFAGGYDTPGESSGVFVTNNYAYIADVTSFQVINVSDPANPAYAGSYDTPGTSYNVYVSGDYIYVADNLSLQILRFTPTDVEESDKLPNTFTLSQNYPNPFNPITTISYSIPKAGAVTISIYNIIGQQVARLDKGMQAAGEHSIKWDAKDYPSGIYFARLESGKLSQSIKIVLMK